MKPFKFRASSLSDIMTEPKAKSETLSVGAKTVLEKMAKELVYGYSEKISSKHMEKGLIVEDQSIELYNSVFFTEYAKNTERRENDWITGECDIFTGAKIIDIKSCWSLPTFPAIAATGADKGYEWQVRAYMWLWDVDEAEVAYCMVNTPDELIGWEDPAVHYVDQINPMLRVTPIHYQRDKALEERIKFKVDEANKFITQIVQQIAAEHGA